MYGYRLVQDNDGHVVWGWYTIEFSLHMSTEWRLEWDRNNQPRMKYMGTTNDTQW